MIPTQLPAPVTIKPAQVLALDLQPGQVLEAVVTGQTSAGATQVLVGKQQMALALQEAIAPGTVLQMRVETSPSGTRLAIVAQTPPQGDAVGGDVLPQAAKTRGGPPALPSQAALADVRPGSAMPAPRLAQPVVSPAPPSGENASAPTPATVVERHDVSVPRLPGAPAQAMKPGQMVEARVIGLTSSGETEVSIGKQQVTVPLPNPPQPGSVVQLRLEETPVGQRLVLVQPPPAATGEPVSPAPQAVAAAIAPATGPAKGDAVAKVTVAVPAPAPVTAATPVAQHDVPTALPGRTAPPMPQTEQAAVAQMVQVAASRQDTAAPLMAALVAVGRNRVTLPPPVAQAAGQVLATRVNLDAPIDGDTLQKAVLNSGVFQEAQLAAGQMPVPAQRGDLKAALLALRGALVNWLGDDTEAPEAPALVQQPPVRGSLPRAFKARVDAGLVSGSPEEMGKALLDRTDNALARVRLHQHASLPEPGARVTAEWHLELPVIINQQQSVMQFQITRDGDGGGEATPDSERSWHIRFAVNLSRSGEVGAQVGLRGRRASVLLWAESEGTAQNLRIMVPHLTRELTAAGLEAGPISVRSEPPAPQHAPPAGNLVDTLR